MKRAIKAHILLCLVSCPALVCAQMITGTPNAATGDTLTFGSQKVRLADIESPKTEQTCQKDGVEWACGIEARNGLDALIVDQQVTCRLQGTDGDGQVTGQCSTEFLDLNVAMAELGWAVAIPTASTAQAEASENAKGRGLGIWGSHIVPLAADRKPQGQAAAVTAPKRSPQRSAALQNAQVRDWRGCAIKGNRNRRGEWIYHLPGMPYYDQTRAEEFFCTENQAQAAGYRRAIVR